MFRGRWQQGDEARIGILCQTFAGIPGAPETAPTASVYNSAGSRVYGPVAIPPKDRALATGFFEHFIRLGLVFPPGVYTVLYSWTIATDLGHGGGVDWFEVLPGGDPSGTVIAMEFFQSPQATYIVQQRDDGTLRAGKNPTY